jgi:YVTN family beta-propeller protein
MLSPAKSLPGLLSLALACGCAADPRSSSREVEIGAEPMGQYVAPSVLTHPDGIVAATLRRGGRPFGVAVSRTGSVYCTLLDAASLVQSTLHADSLDALPVGQVPTDVAFSPAGTWAYVTNQGAQTVGVVDARTARQVHAIDVPGDPYRVIVGPEGQQVYVTTNAGILVLIDPAMRRVTRTVQLGRNLNGLALSADGTRVYVGDVEGTIYELDAAGDVLRTFAASGRPQGLGLSADGRELYAAGEDGDLIVLSLDTGAEIARVALGAGGFGLAVTPDQTQVWVTSPAAGRVFVLDRVSHTIRRTLGVGGIPRRLAFDRSGTLAVVADETGAIRFVR